MIIGLFGGTFDPIHNGHIQLAENILVQANLDEIWFLVTPLNPWKKNNVLSPDEFRLEMVRKALETHPRLIASDYEFHLDKPSYSYKTLRHLREDYPEHRFALVIGADNWVAFNKWAEYEEILSNHDIVVYPREGYSLDESTKPDNVIFADTELYDISSTEIRERIKRGESVADWVPESIQSLLSQYKK